MQYFAVSGVVNSRFPIAESGSCCAKICRKGPVIEERLDAVKAIICLVVGLQIYRGKRILRLKIVPIGSKSLDP